MLEVALHNPRQHKQFRRDSGPLVLARASADPALWTTVDDGEAWPNARIEIVPQVAGVSLAVAGCEAEYHDKRNGNPIQTARCKFRPVSPSAIRDSKLHSPMLRLASPIAKAARRQAQFAKPQIVRLWAVARDVVSLVLRAQLAQSLGHQLARVVRASRPMRRRSDRLGRRHRPSSPRRPVGNRRELPAASRTWNSLRCRPHSTNCTLAPDIISRQLSSDDSTRTSRPSSFHRSETRPASWPAPCTAIAPSAKATHVARSVISKPT